MWGQILNSYLSVTHNADGTLKDETVTASTVAPGAISAQNIQSSTAATNGQVLSYDAGSPSGLSWSSVAATQQENADWMQPPECSRFSTSPH